MTYLLQFTMNVRNSHRHHQCICQTNNTGFSQRIFKVHWGWRWDFRTFIVNCGGRDNSVSVYRLGTGCNGSRIESWWGARFSAIAQTGSGVHPVSCKMGGGGGVALATHPYLAPRLKKEQKYTSTSLWAFMVCSRTNFIVVLYNNRFCRVLLVPLWLANRAVIS